MKKKAIAVAAVAAGLWASSSLYFLSQSMPRKEKPALGRRRIACIGDSITFGAGVLFGRERLAWPFLLDRLLGGQFQVMNFGISGATVQQEGDSPYREDFFLAAQAAEAETYILMLGTNDSKPFKKSFLYMIAGIWRSFSSLSFPVPCS